MTSPVSIQKQPRKQHTPEFRNEALKLVERIGVAAAARVQPVRIPALCMAQ